MFNVEDLKIVISAITYQFRVTVQEVNKKAKASKGAINLNRWQLRELLKGTRIVSDDKMIKLITNMDETELREGNIEYLLSVNHSSSFNFLDHKAIESKYILSPGALDGTKEEFYNEK